MYNKIYEFNAQVFGEPVKMVMTSVSGHLLNYEFVGNFKNWHACNPLELFDAPIQKFCPPDSQNLKVGYKTFSIVGIYFKLFYLHFREP